MPRQGERRCFAPAKFHASQSNGYKSGSGPETLPASPTTSPPPLILQKRMQLCPRPGFYLKAMENKPSDLRESLWRRKPAARERADLRAQPELELEARLTEALAQIADAPVASNFTSRVLAALDHEEARASRSPSRWNWHWLLPRLAVTAAMLFIASFGIRRHEINSHHIALAKDVAMVAVANPLPSVEALENLDAIQRMGQSTHADGELLAALQ